MWIALRELTSGTRRFRIGDSIPNYPQWPEVTRRALQNLEWVTQTPNDEPELTCRECGFEATAPRGLAIHTARAHR